MSESESELEVSSLLHVSCNFLVNFLKYSSIIKFLIELSSPILISATSPLNLSVVK